MKIIAIALSCLLFMGVSACSKSSTPKKAPDLLSSQRAAMEKAKQTEQVMEQAAEKERKEIEKQQM